MKTSLRMGAALACFSGGVAMAQTAPAQAQSNAEVVESADGTSGLEEIIVTATRREENLQTVPVTVTAVSGEQLASSGVKDLEQLSGLVSGFEGPGTSGTKSPHIRGIGSQIAQPGIENSIATYVDGVYIGATTPALLRLNSVRDVQVLKGPQGTLFGRNTTGGLLQVTTRDPDQVARVEAELEYANYDTFTPSAYVNVPLGSAVSTNLAVKGSWQGDGWGKNVVTGNDGYRHDFNIALRNKWRFDLGPATRFDVIADYEHVRDDGIFALRPVTGTTNLLGYTSTVDGWDVANNADQYDKTTAWGLAARLTHDLGFATLTNTLAYRKSEFNQYDLDADNSPIPFLQYDRLTQNSQWTEELQFASNSTGPLRWTAGLFYYDAIDRQDLPFTFNIHLPPPSPPIDEQRTTTRLHTSSYAGYAEGSYKVMPETTLTVGLRYTRDTHGIRGETNYVIGGAPVPGAAIGAPPVDTSYSKGAWAWRISLAQQLTPDAMIFASYNRGTKSGGYNPSYPNNEPFDDEKLDAYEIGTKLTLFDRKMRFNVSGFYYDYTNIQVTGFNVGNSFVYTGPAARLYGADVDIELRPVENLSILANASIVHSEFTSFPNAVSYTPLPTGGYAVGTAPADGNPLPLAPKFTGSVTANYSIPSSIGTFDLTGTFRRNSGYNADPAATLRQDAFNTINASVQYSDPAERYYVRVWGANLSNARIAQALGTTQIGTFTGLEAPRTYGVTLGFHF